MTRKPCRICGEQDNGFTGLRSNESSLCVFSSIEFSLNRQGMLRARVYDDTHNQISAQDVVQLNYCPICGRKFGRE